MSPKRPSGRRLAALIAALCVAALALGAFAFPRLAADGVPASLKAKPDRTPSLAELKLEDGRCGRKHDFELESDVFERTVGAPT